MSTSVSSPRLLLIAGILILVVNAIALGGAAWNRSAEDARLRLSERELSLPPAWRSNAENSGIALSLQWRVPATADDLKAENHYGAYLYNRSPPWLDQAKLLALGFDDEVVVDHSAGPRRTRPQSRDVWLVLELDGADYARVLAGAQRAHERAAAELAARPDDRDVKDKAETAERHWLSERDELSRLFVIDAGLDPAALRDIYPDRERFIVASGQVRPQWRYSSVDLHRPLSGDVHALNVDSIHVSTQFRAHFESRINADEALQNAFKYTVTLAYGRRHEPWIVAVEEHSDDAHDSAAGPAGQLTAVPSR